MRFLLIRFSSLGDIVLQTSFASWLKSKYPEAKISFLTLKGNEALIQNHPHIDKVLTYSKAAGAADIKNLWSFCDKELKAENIDIIVDLHGTTRSFLVRAFLPSIPALAMDKRRLERFLLVKTKIDLLKKQPSLHERNLKDMACAFNKKYDKQKLIEFIAKAFPGNQSLVTSSVTGKNISKERLVVLAPGASFEPKRWPAQNFLALAQMLLESNLCRCSVVGGVDDDFCEIFNSLEKQYPEKFKNLQGKLDLAGSMEEVAKASLVIGNDSLMGHVAESVSTPSFVIFGPTSESFGFAPHLARSKTFSVNRLWCRPCSTTGKSKCFRKKQYCMTRTTPENVFSEAKEYLNQLKESDAL